MEAVLPQPNLPSTPPFTPPKNSPSAKPRTTKNIGRFSINDPFLAPKSSRQVREISEFDLGSVEDLSPGDSETETSNKVTPVHIPETPFETEYSRILFQAVDEVQSLSSLGDVLEIPQLVIVGGQSAGKSSLLQTLTGIPFPVDEGCCTRFPTRIVSTRTAPGTPESYRITITRSPISVKGIVPAPKGYEKYHRTGGKLTPDNFVRIIKEVSAELKIRSGTGVDSRNFASENLKVELSGPTRTQFSLLDLPGQFRNPRGLKQEDKDSIEDMIIQYIKDTKNTVVSVVEASFDFVHQDVPTLVSKHGQKERTIGVFTKCDMIINDLKIANSRVRTGLGDEKDEDFILPNGWFFVRNRLSTDPEDFDLDEEERELFSKYPWNRLRKDRVGTTALKDYLSRFLDSKIRNAFPKLRQKITNRLSVSRQENLLLGDPRDEHELRLKYVTNVAQLFKTQVEQCWTRNGHQHQALQILSKQRYFSEAFRDVLTNCGMAYQFQEDAKVDSVTSCTRDSDKSPPSITELIKFPGDAYSAYSHLPKVEGWKVLIAEIEKLMPGFGADQLPTFFDPSVFPKVYQLQVTKWWEISKIYLSQIHGAVQDFMLTVLCEVCPRKGATGKLHEGLAKILQAHFDQAYQITEQKCEERCRKEMKCEKLHTILGSNFKEHLRIRQGARWLEIFNDINKNDAENFIKESLKKAHWTEGDYMVYEVHDVVKGYYECILDIFIHEITDLISSFVSGPESPLQWLNVQNILDLSSEEIELLGSEDDYTRNRRKDLKEEIKTFETALQIVDKAARDTRDLERN
ncbi:P-loop containing nucleoside triphosphate hydrolase protein [Mariannaea sp. PMI_226]|nr:P-loop containing nucleoside triphosphate hydrolase protein [Mariannaea sp. PMI_226]